MDDEPILLELAEKSFERFEMRDTNFHAIRKSRCKTYSSAEKPPDVLITDFAMHEMDGLALIRACRRLNPKQKIILVSGTVDESVFNGTGVRPDRFLAKPYQPAALTSMVQELLES